MKSSHTDYRMPAGETHSLHHHTHQLNHRQHDEDGNEIRTPDEVYHERAMHRSEERHHNKSMIYGFVFMFGIVVIVLALIL